MIKCDRIAYDILEMYLTPKKLTMDERVNKMANLIHDILCEFCEETKRQNCLYGCPEIPMIYFNRLEQWLESEVEDNDNK